MISYDNLVWHMFNSLKDVVESAPSQDDPVSADDFDFDEGNLHTPENLHKIW